MEQLMIQLQPWFQWLTRSTLQVSLLVCIILLVKIVLRTKLAPRWHYCLWLLVIVRMLMPAAPQSSLSVFNLIPDSIEHTTSAPIAEIAQVIKIDETPTVEPPLPVQLPSQIVPQQETPQPVTSQDTTPFTFPQLLHILPILWLIGAIVLAIYVFAGNFRLWSIVKLKRPVTDSRILDLLEDCKVQMNIHTPLAVVETDRVTSPALFGFLRPRLLLPEGMLNALSIAQLRHILLHELAHLKRGDIYLGWLVAILQTIHWFNPIVWFGFYKMRSDRELACDNLALSAMPIEEPTEYGRTIVKLLENFSKPKYTPSLAGILEERSQLKRRITMIAKFKKGSYKFSLMAVILFTVLSVVALTNAKGTSANTEQKTALAESFTELLIAEKFEQATQNFDNKMKNALPPSRLAEVWKATTAQAGPFEKQLGTRAEKIFWTDIIYVTCQFKEGPIDIKVVYNKKAKVSGLWFVPVPQNVLQQYANQIETLNESVASTNSNVATLPKGPQWISVTNESGPKGYALKFNGAGDFVRVPNHPSLEPKSEITIEMWAWIDGPQTIYTRLLRKAGNGKPGYLFAANQDGRKMQIRLGFRSTTIRAIDNVEHTERAGTWHHFAGVYGTEYVSFYVDGKLVNKQQHPQKDLMHSNIDLYIGNGFPGGSTEHFKGMIDEVRIWNVARTEDQIKTNMARSVAADSDGLVAYWNFDEGKGSIANDSSRNKNHGKLEYQKTEQPTRFKNATSVAPKATAAKKPAIEIEKTGFNDSDDDQKRIECLQFSDGTTIRSALKMLGKFFKKNIIPSENVDGQVPVAELYDVTFEEALQAILGTHKYIIDGNLIWVYTAEEFKEINAARAKTSVRLSIPIEIDTTSDFLPGDSIEIVEILGTTGKIEAGQTYTIKAKYKLSSRNEAQIHFLSTNGSTGCSPGPIIKRGRGEFTRTLNYIEGNKDTWLQSKFVSANGNDSFGNLYFYNKNSYVPKIPMIRGGSSRSTASRAVKPDVAESAMVSAIQKISLTGDDVIKVKADEQAGFNFPFYLFIPKTVDKNQKVHLLVEPNNTGTTSDDLEVHREKALRTVRNNYPNKIARSLGSPLLVPTFPRPRKNWQAYTHALDRDTLEINEGKLNRIDLQLTAMIKYAQEFLRVNGFKIDDQIFMHGFSASAKFSNRYSYLHPEMVKAVAVGGVNGLPTLPVSNWNGYELPFPIGLAGIERFIGKPFNEKTFRQVAHYIYMGAFDRNDTLPSRDAWSEKEADIIKNALAEKMMPNRWDLTQKIYNDQNINAQCITYNGVSHSIKSEMMDDVVKFFKANSGGKYNPIEPHQYPFVEYKQIKQAHVNGLYWSNDERLPEWIKKNPKHWTFLMGIEEWNEGQDHRQLVEFCENAGFNFVLKAEGQKDILIRAEGYPGSTSQGNGQFQAFYVKLKGKQFRQIVPGASYSLEALNDSDEYFWTVNDGVSLRPGEKTNPKTTIETPATMQTAAERAAAARSRAMAKRTVTNVETDRQFAIASRVFSVKLPKTSIPDFLHSKLGIENISTDKPLSTPVQLTDEQADEFARWIAATPDTATLTCPKATILDGQSADLSITTQHEYVTSYKKPEDSSAKPEPVYEQFTIGTEYNITPKMQRDGKTIILKIEFNKTDLIKVEKHMDESGNKTEWPLRDTVKINTTIGVSEGKTTLVPVAGMFSAANKDGHGKPTQQTFLLIKAIQK
ncbi:MAG: DUF3887 domain-containing protein [Planctomycetes bacterium]|nr:DUF3887 domain-containing protein [Planctomycetota bacterium]